MNPHDPNSQATPEQKMEDLAFVEMLMNEVKEPARKARRMQKKKHGRKSAARLKVKR